MKSIQKSKRVMQLVAALFLTLGCVFAFRVQADAAITSAPAGVKQTDATSSQALVEWSQVLGTAGEQIYYYVMYSDNVNFTNYSLSYPVNCYSVMSGLSAGKTYYVKVGVSSTDQTTGFPADTKWSGAINVVTAPNSIVLSTFKYTNAKETSISASWGKVAGATGYKVKYYKYGASADTAKYVTTTKNSVTISKLAKNTLYNVLVYPLRKDGSYEAMQDYGYGMSALATLPTKVTGLDCTGFNTSVKKGQAAFSWKANKAADGYQYEIYKYNSNKKLVTGYTNTNSVTVNNSKLKARQYYKIRVRAYVTVSGNKKKVGAWSTVDYFARSGGDDVSPKLVGEKVKLTWKKVAGAQSYTVYWSTSASGKYTKLTTTKSTSYTINKNIPYYKTYYVRVVPNRKVGKKNYTGAINSKSFYSTSFYKYQSWY